MCAGLAEIPDPGIHMFHATQHQALLSVPSSNQLRRSSPEVLFMNQNQIPAKGMAA